MTHLKDTLLSLGPKTAGSVFELPEITLRRYFAMALEAARIPQFRFHDLRHTFASHFAMKTSDLPALQQILGHVTIQMTMRYAHLSDKHLHDRMALMDAKFSSLADAPRPSGLGPLLGPPVPDIGENVLELAIRTGR